jgi:hypothetical protein
VLGRSRRTVAALVAAASLPAVALPALAQAATHGGWRSYVETPASAIVTPVRIVRVSGDVAGAQALLHPDGHQTATMTYAQGGAQPEIVLDFGKEIGGVLHFDVAAFSGTPMLEADYSEQLAHLTDGTESAQGFSRSGDPRRSDQFPISSGGAVASHYGIQGGERYVRLTLSAPGTVALHAAAIDFTAYREPLRGYFLSSDDLLNRVWYAGAYTLNLTQLIPGTTDLPGAQYDNRAILDGAKRDRAIWSGDLAVAGPTTYYTSDPEYMRASLQTLGDHPATVAIFPVPTTGSEQQPGPLPGQCSPATSGGTGCTTYSATYSMVFVPELYDYYLFTGDAGFLRREWASVQRQMAWDAQQVDASGLFAVTQSTGWDWNVGQTSGDLSYVNAVYYQALTDAAKLAAVLGDPSASTYRAQAAKLRDAVNAQLWDAKLGIYDASTTERGVAVQDANVYPVLTGIAPIGRGRSVMQTVAHTLASRYGTLNVPSPPPPQYSQIISPYIGSFQLAADFEVGRPDLALALMRTEWGYMVRSDPGGTTWEKIHPDGTLLGQDSAAHAWGSGPTWALSRYVLGAAPTAAGFGHWSVAPQPGNLAWAEGSVPTPHGALAVHWRRGVRGRSFTLAVSAPPGTSGVVAVPLLGAGRTITRDGKIVWRRGAGTRGISARRAGGAVVFANQLGGHVFAWSARRGPRP